MTLAVKSEYLSVGGNRHSAASAWCPDIGFLAYGADSNVAIWTPLAKNDQGVSKLLQGHEAKVTAIAVTKQTDAILLISGDAEGSLLTWKFIPIDHSWKLCARTIGHSGAVNAINIVERSDNVITAGADALIKLWQVQDLNITSLHTIRPKPRFIPLALASGSFHNLSIHGGFFIVAAGTRNEIYIYSISNPFTNPTADLACSLVGHEGWIRSLAIHNSKNDDYILASTSHDKYVRLWRFQNATHSAKTDRSPEIESLSVEQALTAKVRSVSVGDKTYHITFEALLLGHDDWVYSADWQDSGELKLLTASADGTLSLWESDPISGVWVSETRLGEISGQKGATTATGSSGGFWTGKWVSDGKTSAVLSLGRTGSWRIWYYDPLTNFWQLRSGIGGHTGSVNDLSWCPTGDYLISTSSDQTTRLHAEWRRQGARTWHEFSRCQIHGYDCNVVACISPSQFVSGADEKLLRVFNEPRELADAMERLCGILPHEDANLPETAAVPVLGLSNKAMGEPDDIIEAGPRRGEEDYMAAQSLASLSIRGIEEPPTEDLLSRHSLWPEHEKLYGHGHEISSCAYKSGILATACKASSIEHATIRLYGTKNDWREIKPPLAAHSLTVARLAWSADISPLLLSVGRDRQWTVFEAAEGSSEFKFYQEMPKAHSRMIHDGEWSPVASRPFFATAGRDKTVKLWDRKQCSSEQITENGESLKPKSPFELSQTITKPTAITAISFTHDQDEQYTVLAVGEEDGALSLHVFDMKTLKPQFSIDLEKELSLKKTINRLAWRPNSSTYTRDGPGRQLAIAGADGSVRILRIDVEALCKDLVS